MTRAQGALLLDRLKAKLQDKRSQLTSAAAVGGEIDVFKVPS